MLHARNAEIHADEHSDTLPNPVRKPALRIGGNAIHIEGSGSVTIENSFVNGVRLEDGNYSLLENGNFTAPKSAWGVSYLPMQIELRPVKDKLGKEYKFPFELADSSQLPEIFAARHVISTLDRWEKELVAALLK
jgi:hypothetical protein